MRSGLDGILPRRSGGLDLSAGWSSVTGPVARGEAWQRINDHMGAFGYTQWTPIETSAGVGVRVTW